jgi:hypothetical protein
LSEVQQLETREANHPLRRQDLKEELKATPSNSEYGIRKMAVLDSVVKG